MKNLPSRADMQLHLMATRSWNYKNIPADLSMTKQWKLCYKLGQVIDGIPLETPKRPINGPTVTSNCDILANVVSTDPEQHFGFCFSPDDEFIGIDIDNLPENFTLKDIPEEISTTLQHFPTYVEISPSGRGLHAIYRTNKSLLKHRAAADKGVNGFSGAVYIRNQFLTFTGHVFTPLCIPTKTISAVDAHDFERRVLKASNVTPLPTARFEAPTGLRADTPSLIQIKQWLDRIPATLSDHPLQHRFYNVYRTFTPPVESPSDYDHWRMVAAAVHYASALLGDIEGGCVLFDEWSANDQDNYSGSAAARKKYFDNPPKFDGSDITHWTLAKLSHAAVPVWPYPLQIKVRGDVKTIYHLPSASNVHNFKAMIEHMNLNLRQNEVTKEISVAGNKILIDQHFKNVHTKEALETGVLSLCHDNYFQQIGPGTANSFAKWMALNTTHTFNPIKEWIDNEPVYDPDKEPSYFNQLFDTLAIPSHELVNRQLYRTYLRKSLMGIIRAHYYRGQYSATTGIIILQGPEQTYKSTWVRQLLPFELRQYIFNSQAKLGKNANIKEIQLETGVCQIWLRDEVEEILAGGDAALKNLLVQETDAYRPLYGTTPIIVPRKCIFFGTTNVQELPITDDGSRRIQIIPVINCDTEAQAKIPMVRVFKELLYEFERTKEDQYNLWTLSKDEIALTNSINTNSRKADQDADVYLKETFDFNSTFNLYDYCGKNGAIDRKKTLTIQQIIQDIKMSMSVTLSPKQLKHALKRQCGNWTGTYHENLAVNSMYIEKGCATYKKADGKIGFAAWILPERVRSSVSTESGLV